MKEQLIRDIRTQMGDYLSEKQWNKLHKILLNCFSNVTLKVVQRTHYLIIKIPFTKC